MHLLNVLAEIAERGIRLTCEQTQDRLNAKPTNALTPELIAEIKRHKQEIIDLLRENQRKREDRALEETGTIQSERQVFEMARARFDSHDQEKE